MVYPRSVYLFFTRTGGFISLFDEIKVSLGRGPMSAVSLVSSTRAIVSGAIVAIYLGVDADDD